MQIVKSPVNSSHLVQQQETTSKLSLHQCTKLITRRNRLSAEPWLGGDNRLGRLILWGGAAWLSGLVATLALLPEQVAEVASCPEGCLAQPSNLSLELVLE